MSNDEINQTDKKQIWEMAKDDDVVGYLSKRIVDEAKEGILRVQRAWVVVLILAGGLGGWKTVHDLNVSMDKEVKIGISNVLEENRREAADARAALKRIVRNTTHQIEKVDKLSLEVESNLTKMKDLKNEIEKFFKGDTANQAKLLSFLSDLKDKAGDNPSSWQSLVQKVTTIETLVTNLGESQLRHDEVRLVIGTAGHPDADVEPPARPDETVWEHKFEKARKIQAVWYEVVNSVHSLDSYVTISPEVKDNNVLAVHLTAMENQTQTAIHLKFHVLYHPMQ